jgi:hypothetical protein
MSSETPSPPAKPPAIPSGQEAVRQPTPAPARPKEVGGPKGPEPTRYGDWEQKGRCTDF